MTKENRRRYWWMAAIVVPLIAAMIPVVYDFLKTESGIDEKTKVVADPNQNQPTEDDLRYAERLTRDYWQAYTAGDLRFIMSITATPFYFDQKVLADTASIESMYKQWWEEEVSKQEFAFETIKASTVSQFKREHPRGAFHDRILNSPIGIVDTDIVVLCIAEGEGVLFFYRKHGTELKMLGLWD